MKIYKDRACTELLENLDLGVIPIKESKVFEFWVKNEDPWYYRSLKFNIEHPDYKIIYAPENMNSGDIDKLLIVY